MDPRHEPSPTSDPRRRLAPVVRISDSALAAIDEQLAAHPPERGAALLAPRGCPVITHVVQDTEAEATSTTYRPSRALSERVRHLERWAGLEYLGIVHSHPSGLDHPSGQDERAIATELRANGHLGSYVAFIVTQDRMVHAGPHEILLRTGKLSCFRVYRGRKGRVRVIPAAVAVVPLRRHLERLAVEYDGEVPLEYVSDLGQGPMPAGRIQLDGLVLYVVASHLFPDFSPIVLAMPDGGPVHQLPIEWKLDVPPDDRLLAAVSPFLASPGPYRRAYGPAGGAAVTSDPSKAALAGWQMRFTGQDPGAALSELETARFARSLGIVSRDLRSRTVLLVGLGSVGSYVAEQLVRSGVGRLILVDHDAVEASNLSRTCFDASDVGRPKAEALARRLLQINPGLELVLRGEAVQDIAAAELDEMIRSADLAVASTDDPGAQRVVNHCAYSRGRPALFVGLYRGAQGGEVVMSVPGRTPCYLCATRTRHQASAIAPGTEREVDYGTGRLKGEIALGVDIQHVAGAAVKLGLSLLLSGSSEAQLERFAEEALVAGKPYLTMSTVASYWFYPRIFGEVPGQGAWQAVWLSPTSSAECAVCGAPEWRVDPLENPSDATEPSDAMGAG
jgi:proteasome lid subunit RPN8/RPN11